MMKTQQQRLLILTTSFRIFPNRYLLLVSAQSYKSPSVLLGVIYNDLNLELYRQLFSTVFADFYLFDRLLGLQLADVDSQAQTYLEQLQLTHKVSVQNGKLSTTALSQGQRKRLALLTAYLEDRPIYLFDEWAADQDPFFREIFYQQLLPELKQRGKALLVISHDNRYFQLADRLLKLDYGKIIIN